MGHKEQSDTRADNFQHISFFDHREWNTLMYCMSEWKTYAYKSLLKTYREILNSLLLKYRMLAGRGVFGEGVMGSTPFPKWMTYCCKL